MSGDYIEIKKLICEVQENGIIRNEYGWIIGRFSKGISFKHCDSKNPHKGKNK